MPIVRIAAKHGAMTIITQEIICVTTDAIIIMFMVDFCKEDFKAFISWYKSNIWEKRKYGDTVQCWSELIHILTNKRIEGDEIISPE